MNKSSRLKIWNKYNKKCAYCGSDLEYKQMQVDHIEPKFLGGSDDIENLNPSCRSCNFYKGTFTIEGFRNQLTTLIIRVRKPFIFRLAEKYGIVKTTAKPIKFYFETKPKEE